MKLSRESSLGISLIINLNLKDILIGLLTPERPLLNYLLLIGKIYLWVCRRNKELPSIRGFQSKVKLKYEGGFPLSRNFYVRTDVNTTDTTIWKPGLN